MNLFYRLREVRKLHKKKFIKKFVEELRNVKIDAGRNAGQFLRTPSIDQMENLMDKMDRDSKPSNFR
jgi:hypothetical protein